MSKKTATNSAVNQHKAALAMALQATAIYMSQSMAVNLKSKTKMVEGFLRGLQFNAAVSEREDAKQWKTLNAVITELYAIDYGDTTRHSHIAERLSYLLHMIEAYTDGELFIVAKLAYE